ncbi:MAG: molybdopterin molybdotransferase MoeA [Syntrophobacteraceae bacterium]
MPTRITSTGHIRPLLRRKIFESTVSTIIDTEQALSLVIEETGRSKIVSLPIGEVLGLTIAENMYADHDYPPFRRARMDGYAISLLDAGKEAEVVGVVVAGQEAKAEVGPGRCVEIMTGAPCPVGSEAIVMKEDVKRKGNRAFFPSTVNAGQYIVEQGRDCPSGSLVLSGGTTISPISIAVLTSLGRSAIKVFSPPSVAIITTGDEIADGAAPLNAVQVNNSNGPMIRAQASAYPLGELTTQHAKDSMDSLSAALDQARNAAVVILTGGVSVGIRDLVPAALVEHGASIIFQKVAQKPGRPLLFARRGEQLIFALPGNPIGAHFCFNRYVAASLRKLLGREPRIPISYGRLVRDFDGESEQAIFLPARVSWDTDGWKVEWLVKNKPSNLFSIAAANAYAIFEPGSPRRAGDTVAFQPIGQLI